MMLAHVTDRIAGWSLQRQLGGRHIISWLVRDEAGRSGVLRFPADRHDELVAAGLRRQMADRHAGRHVLLVNQLDVGEVQGMPFEVVEAVPGPTLRQVLDARQGEGLPAPLAVWMVCWAAELVGQVRRSGWMDVGRGRHRFLMPERLLVDASGALRSLGPQAPLRWPTVGALDSSHLTMLSPEGVRGEELDENRGDVFRLGTLLYLLVEGRWAFSREQTMESLRALMRGEAQPFERMPEGLRPLVRSMMDLLPESRPASPEDARVALQRWLDGLGGVDVRDVAAWMEVHIGRPARTITERTDVHPPLQDPINEDEVLLLLRAEPGVTQLVHGLRVDRRPVTNAQFARFVQATGAVPPRSWPGGQLPSALADLPVVDVDVHQAARYAQWAGKRLPTEEEWAYAAMGRSARRYPWGDIWDEERGPTHWRAPLSSRRVEAVKPQSGARHVHGLQGLGWTWEWTATIFPGRRAHVVCGGIWRDKCVPAELSNRFFESGAAPDVGFRCVKDVVLEMQPKT